MRRKYYEQRASALNTVGAKKGAFVVIASNGPAIDRSQDTATFKCGSCKAVFASATEEPFCPNCGSMHVKAHVGKAAQLPKKNKELSAIVCASCGTHNIVADTTAKMLDGRIHCVTCGTGIRYEVASTQPEDVEERYGDDGLDMGRQPTDSDITNADRDDVMDIEKERKDHPKRKEGASTQPEDVEEMYGDDGLDTGRQPTDSDITNADRDDVMDIEKERMKPGPTVMSKSAETAQDETDRSEDDSDLVEPISDEDILEESPVSAEGDDMMGDEAMDVEEVESEGDDRIEQDPMSTAAVSLLATVLASSKQPKLTLAYAEDTILALVDGIHVANLRKENAGENSEIFHSEPFAQAIIHTADAQGIKKALSHFGFEPVVVKFPQGKVIAAMVRKRVEKAAQKYAEQSSALQQTFLQCLSIAAAGLNKGFFRDRENALKVAFYDTLTTAGIRSAEKVIDPVFAKNGDIYHKTLIELATELMKKPVDVRNALAEAIGETKYQKVTAEGEDDQDQNVDDEQMGDQEDSCGPGKAYSSDLGSHLENAAAIPAKRIISLKPGIKTGSIREIANAVTEGGKKRLFNRVRNY